MANTTNYNWETPDDTDLVKDGAAAIRTLGSSVDTTTKNLNPSTTLGDIEYRSATANTNTRLPIGTTGQILSVVAGVPSWVANDVGDITEVQAGTGISVASGTGPVPVITNTVATEFDAKGDLVVGTGADTFDKLTVGANNTVLTADSSTATGLKWAAAAGGGKVLQVVEGTTTTLTTSSSSTFIDTNLTATITPSSASSKILVIANQAGCRKNISNQDNNMEIKLFRDATEIAILKQIGFTETNSYNGIGSATLIKLDTPATTSAITYKTQFRNEINGSSVAVQQGSSTSTIILMEIGA